MGYCVKFFFIAYYVWHGGAVVRTPTSPQEGSGFKPDGIGNI